MNTKHKDITAHIQRIATDLTQLKELMKTVDDIHFGSVCTAFESFEAAFNNKTVIDAAFAFIAQRDDAGRRVGSTKAIDYLETRLRITRQEAYQRLEAGELMFGEDDNAELDLGPEPDDLFTEPDADSEPTPEGETDEQRRQREAEEQRKREEEQRRREEARRKAEEEARRRQEREAKEKEEFKKKLLEEAEENAREELLKMIDFELRELRKYAVPGPFELRNMAVAYGKTHNLEDTRTWLRKQIKKSNASVRTPYDRKDPYASTRKRELWISQPDKDGGCRIGGYLDSVTATMILNALAPAMQPGGPDLPPEEDTRNVKQRRHDQLSTILASWLQDKAAQSPSGGLGTIVISATVNQLKQMCPDTLLPTTVGTMLTPHDLLRLGAAASDFLLITDDKQFKPLALGQGKRTANVYQRIALAAAYMVCMHPGCQRPARECDVHHLVAFSMGGPTDCNNLGPLCRPHHVNNNDRRDGYKNMGYIDTDPHTGFTGLRRADGTFEVNDTVAAQWGASRLLRDEVNGNAEHLFDDPWSPSDQPPAEQSAADQPGAKESGTGPTPADDHQQPISGHEPPPVTIVDDFDDAGFSDAGFSDAGFDGADFDGAGFEDGAGFDIPPAWLYDDQGNYFGNPSDLEDLDGLDGLSGAGGDGVA